MSSWSRQNSQPCVDPQKQLRQQDRAEPKKSHQTRCKVHLQWQALVLTPLLQFTDCVCVSAGVLMSHSTSVRTCVGGSSFRQHFLWGQKIPVKSCMCALAIKAARGAQPREGLSQSNIVLLGATWILDGKRFSAASFGTELVGTDGTPPNAP